MRYIELTIYETGDPVYINPEYITAVEALPMDDGGSYVRLVNHYVAVQELPGKVMQTLYHLKSSANFITKVKK